jgi:hypothetical protein
MIILQLIIAHLLGDFVFQTNKLIEDKYKSWVGTFKHALIIFAFTALVLLPYWGSIYAWLAAGIIFLVHFMQDWVKVQYDKKYNKKHSPAAFFLDQTAHLLLIVLIGYNFRDLLGTAPNISLPESLSTLYYSPNFLTLFTSLILISYVLDITIFQFKRRGKKRIKYSPNHIGMLKRIGAFTLVYVLVFFIYNLFLVG